MPEGSATLPRRQTRRRRGASGAGSGPWRRSGRDRRAACIRRRGERVLRSAQGSSGRRWRARALVSSRHGSALRPSPPASRRARTQSPHPWGRSCRGGRRWPSRRHGIWKSTSRSAASRVRQRGAARCIDNGLSGAMTTGLAVCKLPYLRETGPRPVGAGDNGEVKWMARSFA